MSSRFQPENFQPENAATFHGLPHEPTLIDPEQYDASEQRFAASLVRQADVQDDVQSDVQTNDQPSDFESGFLPEEEPEPQFASGRPLARARFIAADPDTEQTTNPDLTDKVPVHTASTEKEPSTISSQPAIRSAAPKASPVPTSREDSPDPQNKDSRSEDWRNEVSARLSNYRSRRPRAPRYPSLQLKFESTDPRWNYRSTETSPPGVRPATQPQNEAPDALREKRAASEPAPQMHQEPETHETVRPEQIDTSQSVERGSYSRYSAEHQSEHQSYAQPFTPSISYVPENTNNLLEFPRPEFPRPMTPPARPADELAEPVQDRLRIIEAPEIAPPPPALGGILIESKEEPAADRRPGFEVPLQSSSLSRRIAAAAVDAIIVLSATALFAYIFVKLAAPVLQWQELAVTACAVSALLWAGYQYLALVYTGTTLGLRLARLQLVRFNGKPAPRRFRRWRVLASLLSAVSLVLGYFWCFLDEDGLCWHDRITRTHMSPKK